MDRGPLGPPIQPRDGSLVSKYLVPQTECVVVQFLGIQKLEPGDVQDIAEYGGAGAEDHGLEVDNNLVDTSLPHEGMGNGAVRGGAWEFAHEQQ